MSEIDQEEKRNKEREQKLSLSRRKEIDDIRHVLSSQQGRRFAWRLLTHCGVFRSIWSNSAVIHYNAGMQDVGHFIQGEIIAADENAYLKMMKESKESNL